MVHLSLIQQWHEGAELFLLLMLQEMTGAECVGGAYV
jgi:hypothetical protein